MTQPNPRLLDKYEILEEIGRGGFGAVYRVRDHSLGGHLRALKVLATHLAWDPVALSRFLQEATIAARLKHPNIVTVHEVGSSAGVHYIAMRLVDGQPLSNLISDGEIPLNRAAWLVTQTASALDYAHGLGILHRDIKPSNVLVDAHDHVTLTDFGLARAAESSGITRSGQVAGTPAYMAPELLDPVHPAEASVASDVYSLGILAYELVTGRPPFVGPTPAVVTGHLMMSPPQPDSLNPAIPGRVAQVILKAIHKEPAQRYPSAGSFATALSQATREADEPSRRQWLAAQLDQARRQAGSRSWAAATQTIENLLAHQPDAADAQDLLEEIRRKERSEALHDQLEAAVAAGSWAEAAGLARNLETLDGENPDTSRQLLTARLGLAREAAAQKRWQDVMAESEAILTTRPSHEEAAALLAQAQGALAAPRTRRLIAAGACAILVGAIILAAVVLRGRAWPWLAPSPVSTAATPAATAAAAIAVRSPTPEIAQEVRSQPPEPAAATGVPATQTATAAAPTRKTAPRTATPAPTSTSSRSAAIPAAAPSASPTETPGSSPVPPAAPVTPIGPAAPVAQPTQTPGATDPGLVLGFEDEGEWGAGEQSHGTARGSAAQVTQGSEALEIAYSELPGRDVSGQHFIVFSRPAPAPIPGEPTALYAWVFGDGNSCYLNLWLQDAEEEIWQVTFGQIRHTGWQMLELPLSLGDDWPEEVVQNPRNRRLDYPIRLYGLVLDNSLSQPISGRVYLDDLRTSLAPQPTAAARPADRTTSRPATTPAAPANPGAATGRIVYAVWDTGAGTYSLILRNADGKNPQIIYQGATQPDFCLKPSNRIIANGLGSLEGTIAIDLGSGVREVISNTQDSLPACSPEGQRVVFESTREGESVIFIHRDINIRDDSASKRLGAGFYGHYPVWSSRWQIVWRGCAYWANEGGKCGIWQAPDRGGTPVRVSSGLSDTAPDVSPDGRTVAYMSHESGRWQIFTASATGGSNTQLSGDGDNGLPTWSPDGRTIGFVSNRDGGWALWVMNVDGSRQTKIAVLEAGFGQGPIDWTLQRISWGK